MRALLSVWCCVLAGLAGPLSATTIIVPAPAEGADAVPMIRAALERAQREGATEIRFSPGIYHLFRERAAEQFRHVANHDDGLRRVAFPLIGVRGLRIEGAGARFVAHGQMIPWVVEDCAEVTLANFTLDWAEPFFLQASVTRVDAAADAFEIAPRAESRVRLVAGQLLFGEGDARNREGWWQDIEWSYWIDPTTGAAALEQPEVKLWNARRGIAAQAEALGGGGFRLTHAATPLPRVGMVLISKGSREPNRVSPAFHLVRSRDLRLENVTIHHAGGMGVIAERCENVALRHCRVVPPAGGRLVSTTADATHFLGCRGDVLIEDCEFANMLDDAVNVHGVYARVVAAVAPDAVELRLVHFQQQGVELAAPGDVLRFVARDTLLVYAQATVTAVRRLNAERVQVTFAEPVVSWLRPDSGVDNASWQARLTFRRNHVRNNRARAVLVTSAAPGVVEDNVFERSSMSSILVEGDMHFWHESGAVTDLVIRRNRFVGHHPAAALLRLRPMQSGVEPALPPYHRNVRVQDNVFEVAHPLVVEAARVAGLEFSGNRIAFRADVRPSSGSVLTLQACTEVSVRDNIFTAPVRLDAQCDGQTEFRLWERNEGFGPPPTASAPK